MGFNILLAEDDWILAGALAERLTDEGFSIFPIANGNQLDGIMQSVSLDMAILDLTLKGESDGFEVARKIRQKIPGIPLIFATGRTEYEDQKEGYLFGNVDFIKKPYTPQELILRICELKNQQPTNFIAQLKEFRFGNFIFIPDELVLLVENKRIPLKGQECVLLQTLLTEPNVVVKKEVLVNTIWGEEDYKGRENSLNNLLNSLRSKIQQDKNVTIVTIPRVGYKLSASFLSPF